MCRILPDRRTALWIAALVGLSGCGGGDGGGGPTQPPAVAEVQISPTQATIEAGATQQFSATLRDQAGATLTGRTVTWSSSSTTIATITSSGLATGVGEGTTTITARSEGISATASLRVELGVFAPSSNMSLSGSRTFAEVNIPEGVTVTANGNLTLTVEGSTTIEGDLVGDCVEIRVDGGGSLDLSGDIQNECTASPSGGGPDLTIIGNGEMTIDGTSMRSSGDVQIANSPDLPLAVPMAADAGSGPSRQLPPGMFPCVIQNFSLGWAQAPSGAPGVDRALNVLMDGADGHGLVLACNGDLDFKGNVQIEGQSGGDGGQGIGALDTAGGHGGEGGIVDIRAFGDMTFTDEALGDIPNHFFSGSGGAGGEALPDSPAQDPIPDPAPGGSGVGGNGGDAGVLSIESQNVMTFTPESFFAGAGSGGPGGKATSRGADGVHGAERAGPAQMGGPSSSTGGNGGHAPGFRFLALDDIAGDENILAPAADGGAGGEADAGGGRGGNGEDADPLNNAEKNGAKGGTVTAVGGAGGGADFGTGGIGGKAVFRLSRGGDGWKDCTEPFDYSGGMGGMGGSASGGDGAGGNTMPAPVPVAYSLSSGPTRNPGAAGGVETWDVANGGDGGDGDPIGAEGLKGDDAIMATGARTEMGSGSFMDGMPGDPCALQSIGGALGNSDLLISHTMNPVYTGPFSHSNPEQGTAPRAFDHTSMRSWGAVVIDVSAEGAANIESQFPCGLEESGHVVACNGSMFPGRWLALTMVLNGDLPTADPDHLYQYGFPIDRDNDVSNNYVPDAMHPNDLFKNTDRWYELLYVPGSGWGLFLRDGDPSSPTFGEFLGTNARAIAWKDTIVLLIPEQDFVAEKPNFRLTIFCLDTEGNFRGDHQPPVDQPLLTPWMEAMP